MKRGFAIVELVLLLAAFVGVGGFMLWKHHSGDDWYDGPDNLRDAVEHYHNKITDCLGVDGLSEYDVTVRKGTRKGGRCWATYVPEIGMEVCGCGIGGNGKGTIILVSDPNTGEVPTWIVEHEVMECERTGLGDHSDGHDPKYKRCLDDPGNWRLARDGTKMLVSIRSRSSTNDPADTVVTHVSILLPD